MKKVNWLFALMAMLVLLFSGCEDGSSASLTDEDVEDVIMASLGDLMIASYVDDNELVTTTGLTVVTGDDIQTLTFSNFSLSVGDGVSILLNGVLTLTYNEATSTASFTFTGFSLSANGISATVNGVLAAMDGADSSTVSASFVVSNVIESTVNVIYEISFNDSGDSVTKGLINGVDYTEQFNTAFQSMFSDSEEELT